MIGFGGPHLRLGLPAFREEVEGQEGSPCQVTGRTVLGPFSRKLCFLVLISWSSLTPLWEMLPKEHHVPVLPSKCSSSRSPGKRAEIGPQVAQGQDGIEGGLKQAPQGELAFEKAKIS